MPRNKDIHKVLVIGSGPIIIDEAVRAQNAQTATIIIFFIILKSLYD